MAAVLGALSALFMGFGEQFLPIPGQVPSLPLWQLTPPISALVTGLAAINRLPTVPGRRTAGARACWLLVCSAVAGSAAVLVSRSGGLPSLLPATVVLVVLTFGVSALVGSFALWLPAAGLVGIVTHTVRFTGAANPWTVGRGLPTVLVLVVVALAAAAYVVRDRALGRPG